MDDVYIVLGSVLFHEKILMSTWPRLDWNILKRFSSLNASALWKVYSLRRRVTDLLHLNNFCRKKSSESGGLCRLYNIDSPLHLLLETTSVMIDTRV
ncbi:hypothetical protein P8452_12981 [Trifolium repens]|nr:hypothetical protein P8452_12981 [Trifolium repens]